MRASIKEVGFAVFFLIVIALVAVEAAEDYELEAESRSTIGELRSK